MDQMSGDERNNVLHIAHIGPQLPVVDGAHMTDTSHTEGQDNHGNAFDTM